MCGFLALCGTRREKHKQAYDKALVQRYQHLPEVRKIHKNRTLPTAIYKVNKTRRVMDDSERKRLKNRIAHSAPGAVQLKATRKKKVVQELE